MPTIEFTFRINRGGSSRSEQKSPKNSSEKKFHLIRIQDEILNENNLLSSINRLSILILLSYTFFFRSKLEFWGRSRSALFRKKGQVCPELFHFLARAISPSGGTFSPWFLYCEVELVFLYNLNGSAVAWDTIFVKPIQILLRYYPDYQLINQ